MPITIKVLKQKKSKKNSKTEKISKKNHNAKKCQKQNNKYTENAHGKIIMILR